MLICIVSNYAMGQIHSLWGIDGLESVQERPATTQCRLSYKLIASHTQKFRSLSPEKHSRASKIAADLFLFSPLSCQLPNKSATKSHFNQLQRLSGRRRRLCCDDNLPATQFHSSSVRGAGRQSTLSRSFMPVGHVH